MRPATSQPLAVGYNIPTVVDDPRTLRDPLPADTGIRTATTPAAATLRTPGAELATAGVSGTEDTQITPSASRHVSPLVAPQQDVPAAIVDPVRYVIRKELARGGMGRISIADDRVLGRSVAIKEMLGDSPDHVARFQRELTLTARLQHPGIVSVHDGGVWPDGKLVYIMRLVSGEPLELRIGRSRTIEERMALVPNVIAAVDALAYAHSQGIIHRDLKPANILLGDFGETVVIDWGLAKDLRALGAEPGGAGYSGPPAISGSGADTVEGDVIGTPAYMPPEQARGGGNVDERADVYALGAVLYHVLAGSAPYPGRSFEALTAVLAGPPTPLGERAAGIPHDLLAIVERAMATDPDARYRSAAELGVELKRFQNGQLVAAHRYTAWQLARRWIRRRRAPVAVGLIAIAALGVGGILSVRRIVAEEERVSAALALAEHHHTEAVQRGADAERLLDFMIFQLHDKLQPLGRLELLAGLAQTMQTYYRDHDASSPEDQRRRARARSNLGNVLQAKGDAPGALREHEAALDTLTALAARAPLDRTLQFDLANSLIAVSKQRMTVGKGLEALDAAMRAAELAERLRTTAPDRGAASRLVVAARVEVGHRQEERGEIGASIATYRSALEVASALAASSGVEDDAALVSLCRENIGDQLMAQGNVTAALVEYRTALAIDTAAAARHPDDTNLENRLVLGYVKVGDALRAHEEHDAAVAIYRQAQSVARTLSARDPENTSWLRQLSVTHVRLGAELSAPATAKQALAEFEAAREVRLQLATRDPANAEWQRDLMVAHTKVAMLHEGLDQLATAKEDYERARSIAETLAARTGDPATAQRDLVTVYGGLGRVLDALGEKDAALRWLRAGLTTSQRVVAQPSDVKPDDYWGLVQIQEMLGDALVHQRDRAGAGAIYMEALTIAKQRLVEDASNPWKDAIERLEAALAVAAKRK